MANGTFTPQPTITSQADLGRRLLAQAGQGAQSTSGLSPFANLLQGLQGGLERGQATSAAQTNQALQAEATRNIGEALAQGDFSGASAAALQPGIPSLVGPGVTMASNAARAKQAETTRVAQAQQASDKLALERRKVAVLERTPDKPLSTAGKIEADLRAGRISPEQAATALERKPLVTVQTGGQKKFSERLMAKAADRFDAAQTAAEGATTDLADLDVLEPALTNPDVYTGFLGEGVNKLKLAGQTVLGMNFQGVADAEVASRTAKRLAIALQNDLPLGRITDSDRAFLQSIPAGLNASPEANRRLIAVSRLNAQRKIDRARIMESNINQDGEFDRSGARTQLAQYDREFRGRVTAQVREMRAIAKQVASRSPLSGVPIPEWTLGQIQKANKGDFTTEQLEQMAERKKALLGGR